MLSGCKNHRTVCAHFHWDVENGRPQYKRAWKIICNNELLPEQPGTAALEDAVTLPEAVCLCVDVMYHARWRALVTSTVKEPPSLMQIFMVLNRLQSSCSGTELSALFSDCLGDSPQWNPCLCAAKAWWGSWSWECWAPCIKCPPSTSVRSTSYLLAPRVLYWPGYAWRHCHPVSHLPQRHRKLLSVQCWLLIFFFCPPYSSTSEPPGTLSTLDSSLNCI